MIAPNLINTVYIMSKGRPQCTTAKTFIQLSYPGLWYIVVGTNDLTREQYKINYPNHVILFDWFLQIKYTDILDNVEYIKLGSGAAPARNAIIKISQLRGLKRHWQFDDDYSSFTIYDSNINKNRDIVSGQLLYLQMLKIALFGYNTGMNNVGFCEATLLACPLNHDKYSPRVFNAHNLPSDIEAATTWTSRLNDDLINAIDTYKSGGCLMQFKFLHLRMKLTQKLKGGLTLLYKEVSTVRKTAYAVLKAPQAVKLVHKFNRWHHRVNWKKIVPKIINESYKKSNNYIKDGIKKINLPILLHSIDAQRIPYEQYLLIVLKIKNSRKNIANECIQNINNKEMNNTHIANILPHKDNSYTDINNNIEYINNSIKIDSNNTLYYNDQIILINFRNFLNVDKMQKIIKLITCILPEK